MLYKEGAVQILILNCDIKHGKQQLRNGRCIYSKRRCLYWGITVNRFYIVPLFHKPWLENGRTEFRQKGVQVRTRVNQVLDGSTDIIQRIKGLAETGAQESDSIWHLEASWPFEKQPT